MQKKEDKTKLTRFEIACEVVFLTVATIALYLLGTKWVSRHDLPYQLIPYRLSALIVLALDVALIIGIWIIGMKKWWPLKNIHAKVILTLLVLTLSAIILTDLFLLSLFNAW